MLRAQRASSSIRRPPSATRGDHVAHVVDAPRPRGARAHRCVPRVGSGAVCLGLCADALQAGTRGGRARCAIAWGRSRRGDLADAVLAVDARPAELVHADVLAERLAHDLRAREEHPRVLGHDDEVGESGRVGAAARRDAAHDRDLRDAPRELDALRGRCARIRPAPRGRPGGGPRPIRPGRRPALRTRPPGASPARSSRRASGPASRPCGGGPGHSSRWAARPTAPAPATTPSPSAALVSERMPVRIAMKVPGSQRSSRRSRGVSCGGAQWTWGCGEGAHAAMQRTALWPPKPNEFETPMWRDAAVPRRRGERAGIVRDVVEVEALVGLAVSEGRRRDAAAQRAKGRDRLDGARGAQQVADRGLGRGDGNAVCVVAQSQLERLGLRAVVERGRRSVRVHVVDLGRLDPGVFEREGDRAGGRAARTGRGRSGGGRRRWRRSR